MWDGRTDGQVNRYMPPASLDAGGIKRHFFAGKLLRF